MDKKCYYCGAETKKAKKKDKSMNNAQIRVLREGKREKRLSLIIWALATISAIIIIIIVVAIYLGLLWGEI